MKPNYRIYDRTGGGVTHDIYAESLDDAIEQGREWIEDGDWSGLAGGEDSGEGRRYNLGITLECAVSEIVRNSNPSEAVLEALDALGYKRQWLNIAPDHVSISLGGDTDEDLDAKVEKIEEAMPEGVECDMGAVDAGMTTHGLELGGSLTISWPMPDGIDEDATNAADQHDCSGEYSDTLPDCEQAEHAGEDDETDDEGHVWRQPYSVVGGCKENPGEWGGSGTTSQSLYVCRLCGCYRDEHRAGWQRNHDEPRETVTIRDRDEDSEAWLKSTHEEDGFIPAWLAELLDCSPSLRMTEEDAAEYVQEHSDEDELDDEDVEHAFAATFGRRADDQARAEGLWSHLCAAHA